MSNIYDTNQMQTIQEDDEVVGGELMQILNWLKRHSLNDIKLDEHTLPALPMSNVEVPSHNIGNAVTVRPAATVRNRISRMSISRMSIRHTAVIRVEPSPSNNPNNISINSSRNYRIKDLIPLLGILYILLFLHLYFIIYMFTYMYYIYVYI